MARDRLNSFPIQCASPRRSIYPLAVHNLPCGSVPCHKASDSKHRGNIPTPPEESGIQTSLLFPFASKQIRNDKSDVIHTSPYPGDIQPKVDIKARPPPCHLNCSCYSRPFTDRAKPRRNRSQLMPLRHPPGSRRSSWHRSPQSPAVHTTPPARTRCCRLPSPAPRYWPAP